MNSILRHVRKHILRGVVAIIPIALCVMAVGFLYVAIDRKVMDLIDQTIKIRIPGLGLLVLLAILYTLGLIVSNIFGKHLLHLLEQLVSRIPLINTTYQIGKQLSTTLSLPEQQIFKRALLVEYLKPGMWTIGFVTGTLNSDSTEDDRLLKVFIPNPPNPTSGIMVIVRESQTRDPGWTIEEALKAVVSGGIIGPKEIKQVAHGNPPT